MGLIVVLFYDARPIFPMVKAFKCEVAKSLESGFKIKNLDSPGLYEDVILRRDGTTRGWNTLTWQYIDDPGAIERYNHLRAFMPASSNTGER